MFDVHTLGSNIHSFSTRAHISWHYFHACTYCNQTSNYG